MVEKTTFTLVVIIIFCVGFLAGNLAERLNVAKKSTIEFVEKNVGEMVPVFIISEVSKSGIRGTATGGEIRLSAGSEVVIASGTGEVFLPLSSGTWRDATIPNWAQFVASKKGKRAYSVESRSAQNLAPENRIFFRTGDEAQKAGYSL